MRFRKRKLNSAPSKLNNFGYDETQAKAATGNANIEDFTLQQWELYARSLGMPIHSINDMFDLEADFDNENDSLAISSVSGLQSALNEKQNSFMSKQCSNTLFQGRHVLRWNSFVFS